MLFKAVIPNSFHAVMTCCYGVICEISVLNHTLLETNPQARIPK